MIDRFGLPPAQTQALLECHRLRITAKPLGISKIDASSDAIQLQFERNTDLDPMKLVTLLQNNRHARMNGPDKLRIAKSKEGLAERADLIRTIIASLA